MAENFDRLKTTLTDDDIATTAASFAFAVDLSYTYAAERTRTKFQYNFLRASFEVLWPLKAI